MSLKRNKPLARGKRINPSNAKRKAEAYARNFGKDGQRGAAVRGMPCIAGEAWRKALGSSIARLDTQTELLAAGWTPCVGDVQAAHLKGARQMGGHGPGDERGLGPLCGGHHAEAGERTGSKRRAFDKRYGVDCEDIADAIAEELDARGLS